ncbi:MAG: amidohydrolase family protein, partial [Gammaproteobacteria bacterium]|nr:amidohydrolase family protein [Gammaproteobacteria bacterium]
TAGTRIDFREAFWMATAGGGEALGLKVGKFVRGYAFDAIVVDTDAPDSNLIIWEDMDNGDDILQKIIYNADRCNIKRVWVQGEQIKG